MSLMLPFRAMTASSEWRGAAGDIAPGRTAKFRLECGGKRVNGFVVNHDGAFHAYVNRCPHVGTPLDLWENEFLSEDGRLIVCATHGAVFEPASGRCTRGPCAGDALRTLPLRREGDSLVVACPA
jgi:nitrite reductase/ring-hydroxylating ferredoxin subunit